MSKFDSKIQEIMEGCAGKFSGGLQRALFSNGNGFSAKVVKKECDKCGMLMPKYAGRYPDACPMCGDVVDDNDKEVEVDDTEAKDAVGDEIVEKELIDVIYEELKELEEPPEEELEESEESEEEELEESEEEELEESEEEGESESEEDQEEDQEED
tara:strand:- start:155 stop:622 length:468 start_codon:yes stop_codon:yes gene_type:complete